MEISNPKHVIEIVVLLEPLEGELSETFILKNKFYEDL